MASFMDRLNREIENFGKQARTALDEGKLQLELVRLKRQQDNVARDLGMLVHRRERGGDAEPRRIDALLLRLDDLEQAVARVKREIAAAKGEAVTVESEPAPTSAQPADVRTGETEAVSPGMPEPPAAPPPPPPPQSSF